MTMSGMLEYLENRGFKAFKYYDRNTHTYRFEIVKGNHRLNKTFKYPEMKNYDEVDRIQRDFLDDMMHEFELRYDFTGPKKSEASKEFKILLDAQCKKTTGILQINGCRIPVRVTGVEETHGECPRVECDVFPAIENTEFKFEPKAVYIQPARHNGKSMLQLELYKKLLEDSEYARYCREDVATMVDIYRQRSIEIKDVIFNPPATIVFWKDGTKTVVKAQEGDIYDPEKGLAMAISKKVMGNDYSYYNTFKHWLKKCPQDYVEPVMKNNVDPDIAISGSYFSQLASRMTEIIKTKKENPNET